MVSIRYPRVRIRLKTTCNKIYSFLMLTRWLDCSWIQQGKTLELSCFKKENSLRQKSNYRLNLHRITFPALFFRMLKTAYFYLTPIWSCSKNTYVSSFSKWIIVGTMSHSSTTQIRLWASKTEQKSCSAWTINLLRSNLIAIGQVTDVQSDN